MYGVFGVLAGVLMTPFFLWPTSHELFGVEHFSDLYPRLYIGYAILGVFISIYGVAWELSSTPARPTEEERERAQALREEADALAAVLQATPTDERRAWHREASPSWARLTASLGATVISVLFLAWWFETAELGNVGGLIETVVLVGTLLIFGTVAGGRWWQLRRGPLIVIGRRVGELDTPNALEGVWSLLTEIASNYLTNGARQVMTVEVAAAYRLARDGSLAADDTRGVEPLGANRHVFEDTSPLRSCGVLCTGVGRAIRVVTEEDQPVRG